MKRIFYFLLLLILSVHSFGQGSGGGNLNPYIPGRATSALTSFPETTPSDTIVFNSAGYKNTWGKVTRNHTFTTINANNTSNASQVEVTFLPDSVHSIIVDTSAATGFNMVGFPDSLHPNKYIFQWFGSGFKPLCTINVDNNTLGFTQRYYSDSMRNNANDVITILNADKALNFNSNAAFTLGTWIRIFSGTSHTVFCRIESGNNPIVFDVSSAGYTEIKISDSLGNSILAQSTDIAIFSGGWHYILATYSGNKDTSGLSIWVDGVKSVPLKTKSGTLTNTYQGTGNAQFMAGASAGAYNFDQFFAANGVLTNGQIAEIYNSNNHLDVSNASFYGSVVAWYPWIGQAWTDYSGNGHTLTATSHNFSLDFK
jgi:hypothetical protein